MRSRVFAILFFVLSLSCKSKNATPAEIENDLKSAMQTYLYSTVNNDSTNIKYRVQDVTYFEDKDKYICEFKVNLKEKLFDTTGIMKANISKDFKKIDRLY
jgi:hypothetical protein